MYNKKEFEEKYIRGEIPWDFGRPDSNLLRFLKTEKVSPCKMVDLGCGTGDTAIYLAEQGFDVIGVDSSKTAIDMAKSKVKPGLSCVFLELHIGVDPFPGGPVDFVYDRGCFHSSDDPTARSNFAKGVYEILTEGGLWFSLIGSADDDREGFGPPKRSAVDIVTAVEPFFEIESITTSKFDSKSIQPAKIWVCEFRKRTLMQKG